MPGNLVAHLLLLNNLTISSVTSTAVNILALAVANLIGGLVLVGHNVSCFIINSSCQAIYVQLFHPCLLTFVTGLIWLSIK